MNTVWIASPPQLRVLFDTDGDRHAEAGHLVEGVAGDVRFGLLIGQTPGMKTPADDGLVAIHRRLDEAAPAISGATLPANAAVLLDRTQSPSPPAGTTMDENGGVASRPEPTSWSDRVEAELSAVAPRPRNAVRPAPR